MSTNAVTGTSSLSDLAGALLTRFDSNKDGSLSSSEFSSLISQLASALNVSSTVATSAYTSSSVATTPIASPTRDFAGSAGRFEGFDLARAQDPQKSAKDAFAQLASASGSLPRTKAEAEQWFNASIKTGMEALGHKVNWVQGDKFSFTNWQGTFTVDFIRGADGNDPAYAWQVEA